MENTNFSTTFLVDATPQQAFDAINNVRGWWSENIDGNTSHQGDVFDYHYQNIHRCTIRVTELKPNEKVVWDVLDNYFNFTKDKTEWIGNTIIFDIFEKDGKTAIRFTQQGLTPQYECYGVCNEAWTHYLHDSLGSLITNGTGQPTTRDDFDFNTQQVEKWNLQEK